MTECVILLCGKQGSGKSTLSNALAHKLYPEGFNVYQMKYADPLYEMHDAVLEVARKWKFPIPDFRKNGPLLQVLGTEWVRHSLGPDVWVECLRNRIQQTVEDSISGMPSVFIVEDCRFKNEFYAFPDAFRVRLTADRDIRMGRARSWRANENHQSETDLDDLSPREFSMLVDTGKLYPAEVLEQTYWSFLAWRKLKSQ